MRAYILFLSIVLASVSCKFSGFKNPPYKKLTQIDSLIHLDSIIAIYTYSSDPIRINDDIIDGEAPIVRKLHCDTLNKWTKDESILRIVKETMPRFDLKTPQSLEYMLCCGYSGLFIQTDTAIYNLYWQSSQDTGWIKFNDKFYSVNTKRINQLLTKLDGIIIRKEIVSTDTLIKGTMDFYNRTYQSEMRRANSSNYEYILK
jgi:hypothetical protein